MSYIEAIISGIVQGLTEFLPVSSSGHLVILHHYLGYREPQLFLDIILHIGTLFAVLIYFWRDIIKMLLERRHIFWLVIIATIPAAIIGFLFKDILEAFFSNIKLVGGMLLVTAVFLFLGEWASLRRKDRPFSELNWLNALFIGIIQAIAIIPGISRSGSTISAGLMLRLNKKEAVKFSFLIAIPAIFGALLLKLFDISDKISVSAQMLTGGFIAFLIGLGAIHILIKTVLNNRLRIFAIYCLIAGGAILIL